MSTATKTTGDPAGRAAPKKAKPSKSSGPGQQPFGGASVLSNGIPQIFLFGWMLMVVLPMIWVLLSSMKTNKEIYTSPFGLPDALNFQTYANAWERANIGQFLFNSLVVVCFGVFFTLLFSAMVAYAIARYSFPGSKAIYYTFVAGMAFPVFLAIVPLVKVTQNLGLFQSKIGLIIVYVAFSLPFSVFFLTAFFQTLPRDLAEAAFIDGAGHFRTFFQVMLPLAKPGLISIGVFNFLGQWNQYLLPVALNPQVDTEQSNFLLTQGLADLALNIYYEDSPTAVAELFAGLVIAMLPVILVYIVFQRKVEEGLTAGALR